MNKTSKKIASIALAITTSVWMSGALLLVPVAQAQTTAGIQAQINALLAQIQQLQAQLSQPQGGTAFSFTRNLTVGSTGADVKALQQFLNAHGAQVAASGAGSPGNETTYFGPLTRAAVAKWQAANGISPTAGYFGPKTMAAVAALGGVVVIPPPGGVTPPGGVIVPAPASGLQVGLASTNPAPGSLIAGSARASVFAVNLTAGTASGITVSDLKFHKTGVVSDSSIAGAYLVEDGKVLNQYTSLSNGVITFSGLGLSVAAGQTRQMWLQIDTATGVNAGNTVSFSMTSASDVAASDATAASVTASGVFPLNGNTFTVTTVSSPSIASMTVASTSIGTQVTAGTQNSIVGGWQFTVSNSAVNLNTINFKVIGSANKGDIRNVKLKINGVQVGPTLASVASDGTAFFNLSSNPARLNTGANNIQVFADVMGSPSFTFQVEILNSYDIYALDSQYNVPVTAGSNTGTSVSIRQGSITVTQDSTTPTGNVAKGQTGITLAKFDVYAAGEAVKIKWLGFSLVFGTGAGATLDTEIKNVHLDDDAGGQVGTTISSLVTAVTCTDTVQATATTTASNCFGNSTSPVNYIVPANTTRVLSLKGDIQSGAGFSTVTASLTGNTSNLQGLTSSQTASSGSVSGSALSLATTALTVAKNSGFGTPTYAANSTNHKIGSYAFTASSAEGVTISNLTVTTFTTSTSPYPLQNLLVKVGAVQFGSTVSSLSSAGAQSFSGTAFTVPAGGTTYVDVYADLLSSAAGTMTTATVLSGCSGSGIVSFSAISCTSTNGQSVAVAGQPALQIALDSGTAGANQIVMGSTGNSLATYLFTETSNADSVKITSLKVRDALAAATTTVLAGFENLCLYNSGGSNLGCAGPGAGQTVNEYIYSFNFTSPVVVPQASSLALTLKGDVSSFVSSGATDNSAHAFKIDISASPSVDTVAELITALGLTSNATSTISTSTTAVPSGNTMTVLRTKLGLTGSALGATSGRARSAVDDLGTINFAADAAGSLKLNTVTVTFSGSGPSNTNFYNTTSTGGTTGCSTCYVSLYDTANANSYYARASSTSAGTLGFDLNNYTLSAGASKSFTVRLNSAQTGVLQTAASGVSQTLTATIGATANVSWTDAVSGGISGLNPAVAIPVNINSTSYAAGT